MKKNSSYPYFYFEAPDYVINYTEDYSITISDKQMITLIYLYVNRGKALSAQDVSNFCTDNLFPLSKSELKIIFKLLSISKTSPVISPIYIPEMPTSKLQAKSDENIKLIKADIDSKETNNLLDRILSEYQITKVKPILRYENILSETNEENILVINFSDWHIGRLVSSPGLLPINQTVLRDRVYQLWPKLKEYAKSMENVSFLYVNFLGDMIDGVLSNMHAGQGTRQDICGFSQIYECKELIVETLRLLCEEFRCNIEVRSVPGNHDRVTTEKKEDYLFIAHTSLFKLIEAEMIEYTNRGKLQFINCEGAHRFQAYNVLPEVRLIIHHGDNNLNTQKLLNSDMRNGSDMKLVIHGHEHRRMFEESGRGYYEIINPSLLGNTEYGYYENGYTSKPGQSIIVISKIEDNIEIQCNWLDVT